LSYQHVGQHGAAAVDLHAQTRPSSLDEIAPLRAELERLGYDLQVFSKITAKMHAARRLALNQQATMTPPKSIRRYFSRLGKLGGSRPKHYTPEELEKRKQRLALARKQKQHTTE
jgi:hypothetical protein